MVKTPPKVLLDTNILISALVFGGKPSKILSLALDNEFRVVTSAVLIAELVDVVNKKFPLSKDDLFLLNEQIRNSFEIVSPKGSINILKDSADNRVLEAAHEGNCNYIITGDKELLKLGKFKNIKILSAQEFLNELAD